MLQIGRRCARVGAPLRHLTRRASGGSGAAPGFFELRTDQVQPGELVAYLQTQEDIAGVGQVEGWKGMWHTELGGTVGCVHHLYHWRDYDQRDGALDRLSDHDALFMAHPETLQSSRAVVMLEATDCLESCGLPGAAGFASPPAPPEVEGAEAPPLVCWELRTYQLQLGYDTVPRFLALYGEGLKDKLAADSSGASSLATLLYSDCGSLNVVIELWRHQSLQRAQDSRRASRAAPKWRAAIGEIATLATSFDTQYLRPTPSSPWQ
tara:strand:- start:26 stop:820 length:795 start_codon:yes stop_codon:yes gene_type:complete